MEYLVLLSASSTSSPGLCMSALRKGTEKEFVDGNPSTTSLPSFQETVRWKEVSFTQECFPFTDEKREGRRERNKHRCEFWVMPSGSPMEPVAMATHSCDGPLWELSVKNCREASQKQQCDFRPGFLAFVETSFDRCVFHPCPWLCPAC